jgi:hypothetical protein
MVTNYFSDPWRPAGVNSGINEESPTMILPGWFNNNF